MPIEIRELVIKASVGDDEKGSRTSASTNNDQDKDQAMIQACVESVLEILKQQCER